MVYTPSALNLLNSMQSDTGFANPRMDASLNRRGAKEHPTQAYDISYLSRTGEICQLRQMAPDLPLFQAAFTAFARGTLIATASGPTAVEDLLPGDKIITNERGPSPLMWVGSMTMRPSERDGLSLTRITSAALGLGRPLSDLMTGPGARYAGRDAGD